jgi:hypothetical protein
VSQIQRAVELIHERVGELLKIEGATVQPNPSFYELSKLEEVRSVLLELLGVEPLECEDCRRATESALLESARVVSEG